ELAGCDDRHLPPRCLTNRCSVAGRGNAPRWHPSGFARLYQSSGSRRAVSCSVSLGGAPSSGTPEIAASVLGCQIGEWQEWRPEKAAKEQCRWNRERGSQILHRNLRLAHTEKREQHQEPHRPTNSVPDQRWTANDHVAGVQVCDWSDRPKGV